MRSLLLLCALAVCLILVCKPSELQTDASAPTVAPVELEGVLEAEPAAPKPSLLSLLTLGVAVLGAVSGGAAESPLDANAQLAVRIADTTAQLEASAERVADARAR
ncbi:MAG TPA: hypothetical protein VFX59_17955 [Polyangiales bacterium]|nr:hypothetical protein [Polyangiales bacterium]